MEDWTETELEVALYKVTQFIKKVKSTRKSEKRDIELKIAREEKNTIIFHMRVMYEE